MVHFSGGQPITFSFDGEGVSVNLPDGVLAPMVPTPPTPVEEPVEEKQEEKNSGDHVYENPKDREPTVPSEKQSWNSGGTSGILPSERAKATFTTERMTEALYGGPEMVAKRRFVLAPSKRNGLQMLEKYTMDREELMSAHFRDFIGIHKSFTKKAYRPSPDETAWMSACSMNSGALTTHMGLFLPTLVAQTSGHQQMQWLPRTMKFQIIGAYAQTELGHGSNVRGLQTIAEYNVEKQCFVLNTPTLQSMKFWNSGAGLAATHCVCYAQLVIKGKNYGVHVFFVQLRDEHHHPLEGIEVGDCGNKLGDNGIDCGYIRMKDVHVPREHLLAKKSHVEPDGTYVKHTAPANTDPKAAERLQYMTMLTARANMIGVSGGKLALAATSAVRYSCVRKQGFVNTDKTQTYESEERQIIDYQMQSYRLMKQVAMSYAIQFVSRWMMMRFTQLSKGLWDLGDQDDSDEAPDSGADLPEIHASAAGLKGLCCRLAADGMEDCRKACGGHGYLLASGTAASWADYVWQATAEGDLIVMMLQTARFLIKSLAAARRREDVSGMMKYLEPFKKDAHHNPLKLTLPKAATVAEFISFENIGNLLRHRAVVALYRAEKQIAAMVGQGMSSDQAWQKSSVSLVAAAERHCYYFMFSKFVDGVNGCEDAAAKVALEKICQLYGLNQIMDGNGWAGIVSAEEAELAEAAVGLLLNELRPNAVSLVDAFDIPDRILNSALGRSDGNVYEAIYDHARKSPLNATGPFAGFTEHVKPHLDLEFLKLRGDAHKSIKKAMQPKKKKGSKL
eukprot:TRINITY_DN11637_c0_g2_i1.p1 TRINITY_DN11637_c0_g2~~TRINITY_DN11637_c0_g2_i1.p1  ORF type:complete len:801 (+),score=259.97 TRINITY_DN11637_c0_g2_i1:38-2404(+)